MVGYIRWGVVAAAMALLAAMPLLLAGESASAQDRQRIAVLDLAQQGAKQEAEAIAEELRKILVKSNKYVVIDRTLTTQILKEWETQQSGLTDSEKAVKIGKLYNVQSIVSGKLNKFSSGGWQVSVVMLDAQTGVAIKAETVRHRGDFFSLLDSKVPALGAALVGVAAPPVSAAQPASPASGGIKKLAIYPALYSGKHGAKVEQDHERLIRGIEKMVADKYAGRIEITRRVSSVGGVGGEKLNRIIERAWTRGASPQPNSEFIYKSARKMGADLVLIYETTVPGGGQGEHRVYLFDVANRKSFHRSTEWRKGKLGKKLNKIVRAVINQYPVTR